MNHHHCMDTKYHPRIVVHPSSSPRRTGFLHRLTAEFHHLAETLAEWRRRHRSRLYLAHMSDLELHDLALSRIDADQEAEQPFWR